MNRCESAPPIAVAGAADSCPAIDGQLEPHMRKKQCEGGDDIFDGRYFGRVRLEELEPRGHVGEKIPYLDCESGQQSTRAVLDDLARADVDAPARAGALDLRNRRDARESLAPEAKAGDGVEVTQRGDLARRVTNEGQRQLVRGDAIAVVAHTDRRPPRSPHVDADP